MEIAPVRPYEQPEYENHLLQGNDGLDLKIKSPRQHVAGKATQRVAEGCLTCS